MSINKIIKNKKINTFGLGKSLETNFICKHGINKRLNISFFKIKYYKELTNFIKSRNIGVELKNKIRQRTSFFHSIKHYKTKKLPFRNNKFFKK